MTLLYPKSSQMFYLTKNISMNTIPSAVSIIVWTIISIINFTISLAYRLALFPHKGVGLTVFPPLYGGFSELASVGKSSNTIIPSTLVLSKYSLKKELSTVLLLLIVLSSFTFFNIFLCSCISFDITFNKAIST